MVGRLSLGPASVPDEFDAVGEKTSALDPLDAEKCPGATSRQPFRSTVESLEVARLAADLQPLGRRDVSC